MSAFICSDFHIATIASFVDSNNAQELANRMKRVNINSVNYRYNESTKYRKCSMKQVCIIYSKHDIAKLIDCWDYQSCEKMNDLDFDILSGYLRNWKFEHEADETLSELWSI